MQPDPSGKYPYTSSWDCAMKTLKSGGPLKFYTGFPVYCVRIAPHVMVYSPSISLCPFSLLFVCILCFRGVQHVMFLWETQECMDQFLMKGA